MNTYARNLQIKHVNIKLKISVGNWIIRKYLKTPLTSLISYSFLSSIIV